jgi:hypothetical protein
MFLLKQVLPSPLLALVVGAVIAGLGLFWRSERGRAAFVCLAAGLGYAAGHFLVAGVSKLPPADTTNWLPYLGLVMAVTGAGALPIRRQALRWLLIGLIAGGGLRLLLGPIFRQDSSAGASWLWVVGLSAATVVLSITLNLLSRSPSNKLEAPLCLLIVSAGSAGALILSGSLLLGQFALVLTGSIAGASIAQLRGRAADYSAVVALLLVALLASGYFFADLKAPAAGLLVTAPLFALAPNRIGRSSVRFAVRLLLVTAPVLAAVILAFRSSPPLDY